MTLALFLILAAVVGIAFGFAVAAWWFREDVAHWMDRAMKAERREQAEKMHTMMVEKPSQRAEETRRRLMVGEWHGAN